MIEISFNRSVRVSANKVYRIGMVLNKVGWYTTQHHLEVTSNLQ